MSAIGSSAWRAQWWGPGCNRDKAIVKAYWMIGVGAIECHKNAVRIFRALGRIMHRHGYAVRRDVTGCYNCRKITGGSSLSAHAQGIALDVNWDTNPYRLDFVVTDMPKAMIKEIQALKNDVGVLAIRWGGDWDGRPETAHSNYDAMHFEVICTPLDSKIGFSIPSFDETDRREWPLLALNEKGGAVTQLQLYLADEFDLKADGYYGPLTESAVKSYQTTRGMPSDGIVGLGTWTGIIHKLPRMTSTSIPPTKGQAA